MSSASSASLLSYAAPLMNLLGDDDINELSYNGNGTIAFIETLGEWKAVDLSELFSNLESWVSNFARLVASFNNQNIDSKSPLLSGTLPGGERIQIVSPPCANFAFSIRKPTTLQFTLEDYKKSGALDSTSSSENIAVNPVTEELRHLYASGDFYSFIQSAVKNKKNIIISGGTSSGKTTFYNAIVQKIPMDERLITIEDAREIVLSQPNRLHLLAPKNNKSVSFIELLEACLRLRPDRIMAAEVRGPEAFAYLRAINTGHPGSITTVHANDPEACFQQLYMMLAQAKLGLNKDAVEDYVKNVVDVVIQLNKVNGKRQITEIWYKG